MARGRGFVLATAVVVLAAVGLAVPAQAQGTFGYRKSITMSGGAGGIIGGPHLNFPVLVSLPNDASLLARVASGGRDIVFRGEDIDDLRRPRHLHALPRDRELRRRHRDARRVGAGAVGHRGHRHLHVLRQRPGHPGHGDAGRRSRRRLRRRLAPRGDGPAGPSASTATAPPSPTMVAGARAWPRRFPLASTGRSAIAQNFSNGDGTYDFVDVGSDGSLNISGAAMTMQAWVRHNIVVGTRPRHAPASEHPLRHPDPQGVRKRLQPVAVGRTPVPCPGSARIPASSRTCPGRSRSADTDMAVGPGQARWHHIVTTYDGATQSIYVDGVLQASQAKTGNIAPSAARAGRLHRPRRPAGERGLERPVRGRHRRGAHLQRRALRQLDPQRVPQPVGAGVLLHGRWSRPPRAWRSRPTR